jgi:hypothetical protein
MKLKWESQLIDMHIVSLQDALGRIHNWGGRCFMGPERGFIRCGLLTNLAKLENGNSEVIHYIPHVQQVLGFYGTGTSTRY